MFQVKNKETGQEYTVYAVGDEYLTRFLIYEDNHWKWQCMDDFVPVNTKSASRPLNNRACKEVCKVIT